MAYLKLLDGNGVLVDIRENEKYVEGIVNVSVQLLPLSAITEWLFSRNAHPYILMYTHGMRRAKVCHVLKQIGLENVLNLDGGRAMKT